MARRLSSGLRINTAADDAAGSAVAERLHAKVRSMSRVERNMNDAVSLVNTAEGGLGEIHGMLQRLRELAVQAANGGLTNTDRATINTEFQLVKDELQRTAKATIFKDLNLLDGSIGGTSFNQKSVEFDGVNEFLVIDTRGIGKFTEGLTFSMWLQPDSYPLNESFGDQSRSPVGVHASENGDARGIYAITLNADGTVQFTINEKKNLVETANSDPLAKNEWHHVAGVWQKNLDRVRLYVNGEQVSDVDARGTDVLFSEKPAAIAGRSHSFWSEHFDGNIDEVSLWSAGLDEAEITTLYNEGLPSDLANNDLAEDALKVWYRMGDAEGDGTQSGGVIHDQAGSFNAKPINMESEDVQDDVSSGHVDFKIGVGTSDQDTLRVRVNSATLDGLGLAVANVSTTGAASAAIDSVDSAMQTVSESRAHVGATANRLKTAVASSQTNRMNAVASLSQIHDADFGETSASLSRGMVRQQAALAVLTQANQQANLVLRLLGDR